MNLTCFLFGHAFRTLWSAGCFCSRCGKPLQIVSENRQLFDVKLPDDPGKSALISKTFNTQAAQKFGFDAITQEQAKEQVREIFHGRPD